MRQSYSVGPLCARPDLKVSPVGRHPVARRRRTKAWEFRVLLLLLGGVALGCHSSATRSGHEGAGKTSSRGVALIADAWPPETVAAYNSVELKDRAHFTGDIAVAQVPGTTLGGAALSVGMDATVDGDVRAHGLLLRDRGSVTGDAWFNTKTGSGTVQGDSHSPLVLPLALFPALEPSQPGSQAIQVPHSASQTLASGAYGEVSLYAGNGGIRTRLRLEGGTYHFASLTMGPDTDFECAEACEVRVTGRVAVSSRSRIGPEAGSGIGAGNVVFHVAGQNAGSDLWSTPSAVWLDNDVVIEAYILGPHGTARLGDRVSLAGKLLGRDVLLGIDDDVQEAQLAVITQQPQSVLVGEGESAEFSVAADGSSLLYQWFRDDALIPGATGTSLEIPNTSASDSGAQFHVRVLSVGGYVASEEAVLTVSLCQEEDVTCDGQDDDCDGLVDEDYQPACNGAARIACVDGEELELDCGDGDACNGEENCNAGSCEAGVAPEIDDGNACTADSCDPATGVVNTPVAANTSCGDGDACNGDELCDGAGTCLAGTVPEVDDGNACTADSCNPATGVLNTPVAVNTSCGDGNACNGDELCDGGGTCQAGVAPEVDDGNACTADSCDPATGVLNTPVAVNTSCGDGDACNGDELCDGAGTCLAGTVPDVDDGNPCTEDGCDPIVGLVHTPAAVSTSCGDGDLCNGDELCDGMGSCQAGTGLLVDDGNPCTADSCDPLTGVSHLPVLANTPCGDTNACNGQELCDGAGSCQAGTAPQVDDGNPCTADSCDPILGVLHEAVGEGISCDDGLLCTGVDTCNGGGVCVHDGPALDDGDPCTTDSCNELTGVEHVLASAGTPCSDGDACNGLEICDAEGSCEPGSAPLEDDGNPCTADSCDPVVGVVNEPLAEGASCNLGSCEGSGSCSAEALCERDAPAQFEDNDPCTLEFCDEASGQLEVVHCTNNNPNVLTLAAEAMRFLYEGADAVQLDVQPDVFDSTTAAVVRGKVLWEDGLGVPNVRVAVLGQPQFGWTRTQINGDFVMVVPGGQEVTIDLSKAGYPSIKRAVFAPQRDQVELDDVVLVQRDHQASQITMNHSEGQVASASTKVDVDGVRTVRVYFPPNSKAALLLPDGSSSFVPTVTVRATEYTVGERGPERMPASLPPASAYTFATELTADEAIAAGTDIIHFEEPVYLYTDNFLGFPPGGRVPVGFMAYDTGKWAAGDNGVVVEVLDEVGGRAVLGGIEDLAAAELPTDEELRHIALNYEAGDEFWRAPLNHFSAWDLNWGPGPPEDADPPPPPDDDDNPPDDDDNPPDDDDFPPPPPLPLLPDEQKPKGPPRCGSRIDTGDGAVLQDFPLVGTTEQLHHSSRRERSSFGLKIPLTRSTVGESLKRVDVKITLAGRKFTESFPPTPGESYRFTWDGLDAMGRRVQGRRRASVVVSNIYDAVYTVPARFGWNGNGLDITGVPSREQVAINTTWGRWLGTTTAASVGPLSLSSHHFFDIPSGEVHLGSGDILADRDVGQVARRIIGTGVNVGALPVVGGAGDKHRFVAELTHRSMMAVDEQHRVHTIQASGPKANWVTYGADGVVEEIRLLSSSNYYPSSPTILPDGRRIFVDWTIQAPGPRSRVRELLPGGSVRNLVDNLPARTIDMAMTPDGQGLYLLSGTAGSIWDPEGRRVYYLDIGGLSCDATGCGGAVLSDVFGHGESQEGLTGCPQDEAGRAQPRDFLDLSTGPDGSLYFSFATSYYEAALCRMSAEGSIDELWSGRSVTWHTASERGVYSMGGRRTRTGTPPLLHLVTPYGATEHLAFTASGPEVSPAAAKSVNIARGGVPDMAFAGMASTDGGLVQYVANQYGVWKVSPSLPTYGGALVIASANGMQKYLFEPDGRHRETRDAHTGALVRSFSYDADKYLTSTQRFAPDGSIAEEIRIERDGNAEPTAVLVDPDGDGPAGFRMHGLTLTPSGVVSGVDYPGGEAIQLDYSGSNARLITGFTDRAGRVKSYEYDEYDRLIEQTDPIAPGQSTAGTFALDYRKSLANGVDGASYTTPSGRTELLGRENDGPGEEERFTAHTDATTSSFIRDGNVTTSVARDGTQTVTTLQPDLTAPPHEYATQRQVTLPSGLTLETSHDKSATLSSEGWLSQVTDTQCTETAQQSLCTVQDHDAAAGQRTTTSPQGRVTTEILDALNRVVELHPAGAPTVRTEYDGDHVTSVTIDPDGVDNSGDERQTVMQYSAVTGLLESVKDPLTHVTLYSDYDASDRPGKITLGDSSEVEMTYDPEGNLATVTPPGKTAHGMTYGPNGRIATYTPPEGNTVEFFYDPDRRRDLIDFGLDALGQPNQVDFSYDPTSGLLTTVTSPSGAIDVGFTAGHMTTLTSPSPLGNVTTSIDYDGMLPVALSWSGPVAGEVQWTYNDRFLIEKETIGSLTETELTYTYDGDGLLAAAGDLSIERDPTSGRVLSKTFGNIKESYSYNEFAELSRQTVNLLDSAGEVQETLYDVIYDDDGANGDRDALGRITKKTEWLVQGDAPGTEARPLQSHVYDYGYNTDGRSWLEGVAVDGQVVSTYGYDLNGNRTSADQSWSSAGYGTEHDEQLTEADTSYDNADRLQQYGDRTYSWNNFGQLESTFNAANGDTTHYEYDLYGNLLQVELPDGRTIEYDIDGAGRRVARRELASDGTELSFKGWIYRDLLRPIAEVNALGEVTARYIFSDAAGAEQNGLSQLATRLGASTSGSLGVAGSNVPDAIQLLDPSGTVTQTLSLIKNQVGSVQLVTDATSGTILQRLSYTAFGEVLTDTAPGLQPFGFAGGLYDADTGLVRFGARDYDANTGRWTAKDPIRWDGGQENLYVYVEGDMVTFMDPLGEGPLTAAAAAAGCTAAVVGSSVADAVAAADENEKLQAEIDSCGTSVEELDRQLRLEKER